MKTINKKLSDTVLGLLVIGTYFVDLKVISELGMEDLIITKIVFGTLGIITGVGLYSIIKGK